MSYLDNLNTQQKQNASILLQEMKNSGITNPFTWAAILDVVSKENEFNLKSENLNYDTNGLIKIFNLDKATANKIAHNQEAIANVVYMSPHNKNLGNTNQGDGWKYRGRGFNQITGKANYARIGNKIGVDLVNNPDLLNTPTVAAKAAIQFFKDGTNALIANGRLSKMYNASDINSFKNETDSLGAMYNINAGANSSIAKLKADVTHGKEKATSRIGDILSYVKSSAGQAITSTENAATSAITEAKKKSDNDNSSSDSDSSNNNIHNI